MPFAKYLYVDDMRNPPPRGSIVPGATILPFWAQVNEAICSLDNCKIRMVTISQATPVEGTGLPFAGAGMFIAGGEKVGYVCEVYREESDDFVTRARNLARAQDQPRLITRGQPVEYDSEYCVSLAETLLAARTFFESGSLNSALDWCVEPA